MLKMRRVFETTESSDVHRQDYVSPVVGLPSVCGGGENHGAAAVSLETNFAQKIKSFLLKNNS